MVAGTVLLAQPIAGPIIDPMDCSGPGSDGVDPEITVLWGRILENPGWGRGHFGNENNHSLVMRVAYGKGSVLLTGDLEDRAAKSFVGRYAGSPLLDVEVYQVGHHGSRNGTIDGLLRDMTPKAAVISMGGHCRRSDWSAWDHGHPKLGIVEVLAESVSLSRPAVSVKDFDGQESDPIDYPLSKAVYATGWDGTVVVDVQESGWIEVEGLREAGCP